MFKTFFKVGTGLVILTGAAIGGALLIAGPGRTAAVIGSVHNNILERIDRKIDDPTALRAQLQEMENEYPERIGQVRGDLAELREQIRHLSRERAICERVVELARVDLEGLRPLVNEATALRATNGNSQVRVVAWDDKVYSYEKAASQVNQMQQTLLAYTNRAADATHDLAYLEQQETRFVELLTTLENERAQFQSQISQLSRQVDAIARNERLIGLMEKRKRTLDECSRYDAISLDHLTQRLDEVRVRQQAELDLLANAQHTMDYEDMARVELQRSSNGERNAEPLPLPMATTNAISD